MHNLPDISIWHVKVVFVAIPNPTPCQLGKKMDAGIAHGILATGAILVIFPIGILRHQQAFTATWLSHAGVQLFGLLVVFLDAATGLLLTTRLEHNLHGWVSLALLLLLSLQCPLGWMAMKNDPTTEARRWVAGIHRLKGYACLWLGWLSIVTGLVEASLDSRLIALVGLATGVEVTAVPVMLMFRRWTNSQNSFQSTEKKKPAPSDNMC